MTKSDDHLSESRGVFPISLALIVTVGSLLRLTGLEAQSLWLDELTSIAMSDKDSLAKVFKEGVFTEPYPPGYHIFLYFWMKAFGSDPWVVRLPSALAGSLTVLVIGVLGRTLFNWRVGLVAAGITAVTYGPLYFSQEGRVYSLLILFVTLAALQLVRLLQSSESQPPDRTWYRGALLLSGWLLLAGLGHYFGFALALMFYVLFAAGALALPAVRASFWLSLTAFAVPYSAWLVVGWNSLVHPRNTGAIPVPGWAELNQTLQLFFNGSVITAVSCLLLIATALVLAVSHQGRPSFRTHWPLVFLLVWGAAPPLITFGFSHLVQPLYVYRTQVIALPAWCILLGFTVVRLAPNKYWRSAGLATALILMLQLLLGVRYYQSTQKTQFREASAYLAETVGLGDLIVGHSFSKYTLDYYLLRHKKGLRTDIFLDKTDLPLKQLIESGQAPATLWLFYGHRAPKLEYPWNILLLKHYRPVRSKMFHQAAVVEFQKLK